MNVLKLYLCGAHSTGKTTLLNDLKPHFKGIKVEEEIARKIIRNHGWSRDDFRPDNNPDKFGQLNTEILQAQISVDKINTENQQDFACDRCLDPLVYADIHLGQEYVERMYKVPGLQEWFIGLQSAHVFVVEPHPECLQDDSVRRVSTIEELQTFTVKLKELLNRHDIPYHAVSMLNRKERKDFVLQHLNKYRPDLIEITK